MAVAAARRRAGQIIADSGASPIAYGIDRSAWDRLVGRLKSKDDGSPDRIAFALCAKAVLSDAEARGEKVKMHFDRGQETIIRGVAAEAESLFPKAGSMVEYCSRAVSDSTGLQAADTIANEFYGFSRQWIADANAKPEPELASIIEGAEDVRMHMMGEKEISAMLHTLTSASQ